MKITRSVRIPLQVPDEGGQGHQRWILASELTDSLNQLIATLPAKARVEGVTAQMMGSYLALVWDEELPANS